MTSDDGFQIATVNVEGKRFESVHICAALVEWISQENWKIQNTDLKRNLEIFSTEKMLNWIMRCFFCVLVVDALGVTNKGDRSTSQPISRVPLTKRHVYIYSIFFILFISLNLTLFNDLFQWYREDAELDAWRHKTISNNTIYSINIYIKIIQYNIIK